MPKAMHEYGGDLRRMSEYEIISEKENEPGRYARIRLRWNEPAFADEWSVSFADIDADWSDQESLSHTLDCSARSYEAMIWDFYLDEVANLCPPAIVFNRSPDELECISDISGITRGMVSDLKRCFKQDENGEAAWIGGSLLLFSYIEILGRLFLKSKDVKNKKASEAFIKVYMPKLADAIETTYKKSLHPLDQHDAYLRFYDSFRNGLSHQYFPKKGHLGIDSVTDEQDRIILTERYGQVVISVMKIAEEFEFAAICFLKDVINRNSRSYGGITIDVSKSCRERLERWLLQDSERLFEVLNKASK